MISHLSKTAYKTANPDGRLSGDWKNIDPVFAGRLAYLCAMVLTESKRTHEKQREYRKEAEEYQRTGILGKHKIKTAARENESWHEFGLAIDTSSQPIRGMTNEQLKPYGLCKPIKSEGWHVQPIETLKLGTKANTAAAKALYPQEETEVVNGIKVIIDGTEKTVSAINVNGSNFVQLRDLVDVLTVSYDTVKKMPVITKKG